MTHPFDQDYFHGGKVVGGYAGEGYWDYPVHWTTFHHVMERQPKSVLELGCARGYVLKRLEDAGVRVAGLEISEHCYLTRVIQDVSTWDITKRWPFEDQSFDLCLSMAVLEHIPEDKLPAVFGEMKRVCARGLHGIDLVDHDHFDKTHVSIHPVEWWKERLPQGQEAIDKELLERDRPPLPMRSEPVGVKLNIGSFTTMFHHGWRNIDQLDLSAWARYHGYSFIQFDVRNGLFYDSGVVDLIFTSHMLEHFTYDEGARLLRECYRVLKPGGRMRVLVPDAGVLLSVYHADGMKRFDEMSPTAKSRETAAGKLYELLCAEHRSIYDNATLSKAMRTAGFRVEGHVGFRVSGSPIMQSETMDLYPDLSLIVEGVRD